MTTDNNAFNTNPQATPETIPPQTSAFTHQLSTIKNESGEQKYDNVPKALDALAHSQAYIPELKAQSDAKDVEIAALKEQLAKSEAVEDVVARLSTQQAPQEAPQATPQVSGLDEAGVLNLLQTHTQQQAAATIANANEDSVSLALNNKFGDKTQEVVANKAAELGMSVQDLQGLSQRSPAAALQLFQVQQAAAPNVTNGSVSIPANVMPDQGLQRPEKSLLFGATTKEQMDYMAKVKADVYKKFDVQV